jgi:hypothetical protein
VLPTTLIVSLGRAETATIEKVPQVGALLRLDQISDLFELVRRADVPDVCRAILWVRTGAKYRATNRTLEVRMRIGEPIRDYVVEPLEEPISRPEPEDEEPRETSVEAEPEIVPAA